MRNDIQADVAAELDWDRRVDSGDITVIAQADAVTLRGTVGSVQQLRRAPKTARRVRGVMSVRNYLRVRTLTRGPADDAEIRTAVLHALMLNVTIPATIDAEVISGVVRLTGTATWQCQREEAEAVCAAVPGVLGIFDEIDLVPVAANDDVQWSILSAYRRHAELATRSLSVDARASGTVILSGTVASWGEHDEALAAAWSAPGVTRVNDRITVIR